MPSDKITVRGAREHNLKNIDVEMPRDRLIGSPQVGQCGRPARA
jgi:excinuclease ABC subunit A